MAEIASLRSLLWKMDLRETTVKFVPSLLLHLKSREQEILGMRRGALPLREAPVARAGHRRLRELRRALARLNPGRDALR